MNKIGNITIDLDYNLKFSHCLYKYVSITTLPDKKVLEGWLKTIDTVTGNIILVTFAGDDSSEVNHVILVTRSQYEDVKVLKEVDPDIKTMLLNLYADDESQLPIEVQLRKELLVAWIKKNRLPFRETENEKAIVVTENVTIYPPYIAESCHSSNRIVLRCIRKLIEDMPIPASVAAILKFDAAEKTGEKSTSA